MTFLNDGTVSMNLNQVLSVNNSGLYFFLNNSGTYSFPPLVNSSESGSISIGFAPDSESIARQGAIVFKGNITNCGQTIVGTYSYVNGGSQTEDGAFSLQHE